MANQNLCGELACSAIRLDALATRMEASRDLILIPEARGHEYVRAGNNGIRAKLGANRPVDNIQFYLKNSASQPAPKEQIAEVAAKYRGAILALGD